jgi:hypothetical protein
MAHWRFANVPSPFLGEKSVVPSPHESGKSDNKKERVRKFATYPARGRGGVCLLSTGCGFSIQEVRKTPLRRLALRDNQAIPN